MKKILLALFLLISFAVYAQVPSQINYQGIARNSVGNVLPNKKITVRLSVHDQTTTGTVVYSETRNIITSGLGLFTIAIGGSGATSTTGSFAGISWNSGAKFLQVEIDPDGASNFLNLGTSPLLAVPYSLYAANAGNATPSGNAGGDLVGTYPNPVVADKAITTAKLNDGSVSTIKIQDLAVTNNKLADNSVTTSKVLDSSITMVKLGSDVILAMGGGGGGNPTGPAGGDLAGNYPNPSVKDGAITGIKLADNAVTTNKISDNSVVTSKVADSSITMVKLGSDVILAMGGGGGGNPTGPAGGDLSGIYPNPSVKDGAITGIKLADNAVTTNKISDNSITTSKIVDASVTTTKLADNSVTTSKIVDASVTSAKLAPGVIPTSLPPNGAANGDLSGTYPNPIVSKIQTVSVSNTVPTTGQVLKFNGTSWAPGTDNGGSGGTPTGPAGGDLSGNYPDPNIASGAITTPKIANGAVVTPKLADGAVNSNKLQDLAVTTPKIADAAVTMAKLGPDVILAMGGGGGGSPTGPAGGDLAGTYPNPTVANLAITTNKIADNSITTSKIVDASVTSAKLAAGVIPTTLPPNGPAGGDLTGSYPNPTVANLAVTTAKLADNSISTTKLIDASVTNPKLADNSVGTSKIIDASVTSVKLAAGVIPTSLPPNGAATGDLSGNYPSPSVIKLQGIGVSNTSPLNGQVLKYNGTQWLPSTDISGGFTLPYTGTDNNASSSFLVTNQGSGAGLEGVNSSTNANTIGVTGKISLTSPGVSSTGLRGINNGVGVNGYGVWGSHNGYGIGVYGFSLHGNGLQGNSTDGNGIFGTSTNGSAGYFDISNSSNSYDAVSVYTVGFGTGVTSISEQGNGLWGITYSASTAGVLGYNSGGGEGVVGRTVSNTSAAVVGKNDGTYAGLEGIGYADNGTGIHAIVNQDGWINGNALIAEVAGSANGNPAVFKANGANVARIDKTGKGFFNNGTQVGGADVAEFFDVTGDKKYYEPGDVLIISTSADRNVEKSNAPYSTLVAGVYATKPGVMLTEKNAEADQLDKMVPMGVIGVIPTKVCLEGGSIKRGDLLVTSSIPGVAMKADPDKVKPGQIIGKSLQEYNEQGVGKINVLVSVK
jgi:hypothetical protein